MSYFIKRIRKIYFHSKFQDFCGLPYPKHPKGCPNFNVGKPKCPYNVPLIDKVIDMNKPMYLVGIDFDLEAHRNKMKIKHPTWSFRQLNNVLYWQPKHRKELKNLVKDFIKDKPKFRVIGNPEAHGINVTQTVKQIGYKLDWHYPLKKVWRIALIGIKL